MRGKTDPRLLTERGATGRRAGIEKGALRLAGADRREQLLQIASTQFATGGLHSTTTLALAKAAGISEPVLYTHFDDKASLFREAVQKNHEARLMELDRSLGAIDEETRIACLEEMAEATVLACLLGDGNAMLTHWALLEAPAFAVNLYRSEVRLVVAKWKMQLAIRFPYGRSRPSVGGAITFGVHGCLAYGFWLATIQCTDEAARRLAHQFAGWMAHSVSEMLGHAVRPKAEFATIKGHK